LELGDIAISPDIWLTAGLVRGVGNVVMSTEILKNPIFQFVVLVVLSAGARSVFGKNPSLRLMPTSSSLHS